MKRPSRWLAASVIFAATSLPLTASAAPGDILHLGTLAGANSSSATDINDAGEVVGTVTIGSQIRAFKHPGTPGGAMFDLGPPSGALTVRAHEINNAGEVAGYVRLSASTVEFGYKHPGTPGAAMLNLGTMGGANTRVFGMNDLGAVVGYSHDASGTVHGFQHPGTAGGAFTDLGTFGGFTSGEAINNRGQVVGVSNFKAFLHPGTPGGPMQPLGSIPGGDGATPTAINSSGEITGHALDAAFDRRAFRHSGVIGQPMVALDTFGGPTSEGLDINDGGYIVGKARRPDSEGGFDAPALWLPDNTMIDLDAWLNQTNATAGARWRLIDATGINRYGIITGRGVYNDGPGGLADGNFAYILDASSLVVAAPFLAGDFNLDQSVTNGDIQWMLDALVDLEGYTDRHALNAERLLSVGDLDGNGQVSNADIEAMLDRLTGQSGMRAQQIALEVFGDEHYLDGYASVPEPVSVAMLALGGVALLPRRPRR